MNKGPAALYRATVFLVGLVCLTIGIGALAQHIGVAPIDRWVNRLDPTAIERFVATPWWLAVLGAVLVIGLWWGVRLMSGIVAPTKPVDLRLSGSGSSGTLTMSPGLLADAAADELTANTILKSVSAKAVDDRGTSIIRIVVTAPPHRSYQEVTEALAPTVKHLRTALDGSGTHVQALVHLE